MNIGGIYNINDYRDGENSLLYYDTTTGSVTQLVSGDVSYLTSEGLGCLDTVNNIFYFIYELDTGDLETGLYGYNLADPSTPVDPIPLPMIMSDEFVGAGDACLSDPNTGDMLSTFVQ